MLKDEKKVTKTLNDYFTNLTKKTEIKPNNLENLNSIGKIKEYSKDELSFEFKQFTTNDLLKIKKELLSYNASVLE